VSPKNSSLAFDDLKEQNLLDEFVPELNVIVNKRHKDYGTSSMTTQNEVLVSAVEVKGMFTVSF